MLSAARGRHAIGPVDRRRLHALTPKPTTRTPGHHGDGITVATHHCPSARSKSEPEVMGWVRLDTRPSSQMITSPMIDIRRKRGPSAGSMIVSVGPDLGATTEGCPKF